ncbi:MAG TPA: polysaccharide deacetylase family protein [Actinomycetota bacterium]
MADRLLVVAWHAVDRTWGYPCRPGAGVRGLARQLRRLDGVANVVPLEPALDALRSGRPLPTRAVALTFDDGYRDNLTLAVPILEELGLPATFFLVPAILTGELRPWWEVLGWAFARATERSVRWDGRLLPTGGRRGRHSVGWATERLKTLDRAERERRVAELADLLQPQGRLEERPMFLDWTGARDLVRRGFSIGSHTMRHAILSRETAELQAEELAASRRLLEAELDVPVRLLAYPNGRCADYDVTTIRAAERAGYRYALTMRPGLNHPTTAPHEVHRVVLEPQQGFCETAARRVSAKLSRVTRERLAAAHVPLRGPR